MPDSSAPTPSSYLGLYRSGLTNPDHRRHITVGRKAMVEDAIQILRRNIGKKPKHHQLFIGPRGIGKTHLLSLLEDEINRHPDLSAAYHVVRFPEESNRILSFADFLLGLCEILQETLPAEPQWKRLLDRLSTEVDDTVIVDTLVPILRQRRRDHPSKQALVVMMENLNQVFEDQIKDQRSIAALRGFLMDDNGCLLLGTAPIHFGAINDPKAPFFDFFDVQVLDQLNEEEMIELIRRNLEWENRSDLLSNFQDLRPRLLAIYRMTGGSPRLALMLYELIANEAVTQIKKQFEILLDRITPYFQDRMNDLSPQERAVLETLALMRDEPKTPTAIAERLRMKVSQTSTLLGRLTKAHYLRLTENPDDKRSRLYTIREGFFDIWLAMNLNRGARKRLPFLLDFFAQFYPSIETRNRKRAEYFEWLTSSYGAKLQETPPQKLNDAQEGLDYLSATGTSEEQTREKFKLAAWYGDQGDQPRLHRYIEEAKTLANDSIGRWIVDRLGQNPSMDYLHEIEDLISCWESHRLGGLEKFAQKLQDLSEGLNYKTWSQYRIDFLTDHLNLLPSGSEKIEIQLRLAHHFLEMARWKESEEQFRAALEEANQLNNPDMIASTQSGLAELFLATNRLNEAEPLMRQALLIDEATFGKDHPSVARDLNHLAQLLQDTNRLSEAEPLIRRALLIDEATFGKDHPEVATHLNNLAQLLKATNRLSEAEPLMRRALLIDETSFGKDHPRLARDLNNLAILLRNTNQHSEAESLMRRALLIDEANFGKDHPRVAIQLINLAELFQYTNRLSEAEPLIRRALLIDEVSFGKDHPEVAADHLNLASLLKDTNRLSDAEPLMRRALEIFLKFTASIGHPHPHLKIGVESYWNLLSEMGIDTVDIKNEIQILFENHGVTLDAE